MNCELPQKIPAEQASTPAQSDGRKREGVSTVSLNHPLAANFKEAGELCGNFNMCLLALAALCFAIPAFADGGSAVMDLAPVGVGLGMGLAAGLCGLGQGRAVGSTTEALAR